MKPTVEDLAARKSRVAVPTDLPAATRAAIALARLGDALRDNPRHLVRRDHDAVRQQREWRDRDIIAEALTGRPAVRERQP